MLGGYVFPTLRAHTRPVFHRPRPALSLHERAPPGGVGASAVWGIWAAQHGRRVGWRLCTANRRHRHRQDHHLPLLSGANSSGLPCGLHLQPQAHRGRAAAVHLRRIPHRLGTHGSACHAKGLHRRTQCLPAAKPCGGPKLRAHHRRGAKPARRRAGTAAPADQPGNQRTQAIADRAHRPARTAHHAGKARARAAGPARDCPVPPECAHRSRKHAIHTTPPGRSRPHRPPAV